MRIGILGWGSLLWETETDKAIEFDKHHKNWKCDGPLLKLEFSRISCTRDGALTLVLDYDNGGNRSQVAYALSKRKLPEDAVCDLRCREGTVLERIGCYFADGSDKTRWAGAHEDAQKAIKGWAKGRVDIVVWTALASNLCQKEGETLLDAARRHVKSLDDKGRAKAAKYVWCAPDFIDTSLQKELKSWLPWPIG